MTSDLNFKLNQWTFPVKEQLKQPTAVTHPEKRAHTSVYIQIIVLHLK